MKMSILHNLREEPWGGGNQFLNALKKEWQRQGVYTERTDEADAILFNSYPFGAEYLFDQAFKIKKQFPQKLFIYRLNGPISTIRNTDKEVDQVIAMFNQLLCDGIIFQSKWCQNENKKQFGISSVYETVIYNAPDMEIFNQKGRDPNANRTKTKLIVVSWSSNPRKGFDLYQYLDEKLNFNKYEMTFVGNTNIPFKHIHTIPAVGSIELAKLLKEHDIFITASQKDPCSNALVEALSCGLPAVALNDGGHQELVQTGGELFATQEEALKKIDVVANNLNLYQSHLPKYDIRTAAKDYLSFIEQVWRETQKKRYMPKQCHLIGLTRLKSQILIWKMKNKVRFAINLLTR